jgi:hypothetical protein
VSQIWTWQREGILLFARGLYVTGSSVKIWEFHYDSWTETREASSRSAFQKNAEKLPPPRY